MVGSSRSFPGPELRHPALGSCPPQCPALISVRTRLSLLFYPRSCPAAEDQPGLTSLPEHKEPFLALGAAAEPLSPGYGDKSSRRGAKRQLWLRLWLWLQLRTLESVQASLFIPGPRCSHQEKGDCSSCHSHCRGPCECQAKHKYDTGMTLRSTPPGPATTTIVILSISGQKQWT